MEIINAYTILVGKFLGNDHFEDQMAEGRVTLIETSA
jgi:hypothetical protein